MGTVRGYPDRAVVGTGETHLIGEEGFPALSMLIINKVVEDKIGLMRASGL